MGLVKQAYDKLGIKDANFIQAQWIKSVWKELSKGFCIHSVAQNILLPVFLSLKSMEVFLCGWNGGKWKVKRGEMTNIEKR